MSELRQSRSALRPSPVFIGFVLAFGLFGLATWRYGPSAQTAARIALFGFVVAGWVVSLCLHEFSHAYLAYRSGDHSVATNGYLTLNPLKYGDVMLSFLIPVLFVLLGGIGLPGGAVYIDRGSIPGKLRHSLVSAAGPLTNVVFALIAGLAITTLADNQHIVFWIGVAFLGFLQVTAALLNLLPIPGLDGFGILEPYLPRSWVRKAGQIGGYVFLGLIALLVFSRPVNHAFFEIVYNITDALGIDRLGITLGSQGFRFWQR